MKRLLLLGAALLVPVALAAETLVYNPAAGTTTKYRLENITDAAFTIVDATASDGSKVPDELVNALKSALSKLKTTSITDSTERVLEVQGDGTRIVENQGVTQTKVESSQPIPPNPAIKLRILTAYRPGGSVDIQELKYDTTGLSPELAQALESASDSVKKASQSSQSGLYGVPYEVGQARTLTQDASSVLNAAGLSGAELASTEVRTFTGRGPAGQFQFSSTYNVSASGTVASNGGGSSGIGLKIESATGTGTSSYLADGRPERSNATISQKGTLRLVLPAQNGLEYTLNTRFESTTMTKLEQRP